MDKSGLTKRAPDVWDSARFRSIFLASSFSCSQTESAPAHPQVTQTVGTPRAKICNKQMGDNMTDIILSVRLGVDDNRKNKKLLAEFTEWLNQKYGEHALAFLEDILKSAQIPFDGYMTTEPSHSLENDIYEEFRHPKMEKSGKWILDDLQMKNKNPIWIKLENQWIKGKVEIKGKEKNIVIEPENVAIPITETLFLKW